MDFPLLDAQDIARDWVRWHPVGRSDALRACTHRPVAIIHRVASGDMADWLYPTSRFFSSNSPFLYDNLRYYLFTGAGMGKIKGMRVQRPEQETEFEPMEFENELGEPVSLGAGEKKPKKKLPIEFHLVDAGGKAMAGIEYEVIMPDGTSETGKSDAEGFIRFPDNIHPGEAKLKLFPKQGHIPADAGRPGKGPSAPDLDLDVELALDKLPSLPSLPSLPKLPEVPELPGIPRPVQILLVDDKGVPMINTPFQVRWPDGKVEAGKTDRTGMISYPKNTQSGDMVLTVSDFGLHLPDAPSASDVAGNIPKAPSTPTAPTAPTAPSTPEVPKPPGGFP